ncbi:unnamed protein product [Triticum turgidum subsp. durum]|uniref:Uncharacterized protein n=1 Tax=Triticum turgidum subsp. durum TaxID=4567 RepID=A0A9R0U555_TRITD|nr:unnamed protein product [Triticum turgidum subsp. durum]
MTSFVLKIFASPFFPYDPQQGTGFSFVALCSNCLQFQIAYFYTSSTFYSLWSCRGIMNTLFYQSVSYSGP